jgi:NAD(P)-dependent dehydrogenase (short-subunit alcohol dehydrogenase family)
LLLVGRTKAKLQAVAARVGVGRYVLADFERLDDVRRLAREILAQTDRIDVLANNAGGMFTGPHRTPDGFERTFQVNHLAAFLLTYELRDMLLASRAAVVNTSSAAAKMFSRLDIDDLNGWQGFSSWRAYGDAKLGNILFARGLHARFHGRGLAAMAFHPGVIASNFAAGTSGLIRWGYHSPVKALFATPERGGRTLEHFVVGTPGVTWRSGQFYGSGGRIGRTSPRVYDDDLVRQHWQRSSEMLGITNFM